MHPRVALAISCLLLSACSGDGPTAVGPPATIRLVQDSVALAAGAADTVLVSVRDAHDRPTGVRPLFLSADPRIVRVDSLGVLHADSSGTTIITIAADTLVAYLPVRVFQQVDRLVLLNATPPALVVGQVAQVTVAPVDGAGRVVANVPVAWSAVDSLVAGVDTTGRVQGRLWGTTQVVARAGTVELRVDFDVVPTRVSTAGLSLVSISLGPNHGCGRDAAGHAWCWGDNAVGEFGDGTRVSTPPTGPLAPAAAGRTFTDVQALRGASCGLEAGGALWCWGSNSSGALGQDSAYAHADTVPVLVVGGHGWRALAAGHDAFTCAIASDDVPFCWGRNNFSQVGRASTGGTRGIDPRVLPVSGGLTAHAMGMGAAGGCLLDLTGQPWCWGSPAYVEGAISSTPTPAPIAGAPALDQVVAFDDGGCGLASGGAVWCWGRNLRGTLGGTATENYAVFHHAQHVPGVPAMVKLSAGNDSMCGITAAGALWCWGNDVTYHSGGTGTPLAPPRAIGPAGTTFRDVSVLETGSFWSTCALATDGALWCW